MKISKTLSAKPRSNFYYWQIEHKKEYKPFKKDNNLAELIGVILGDGHIERFPRTERLIISGNSNNPKFIKRYSELIRKNFNKNPKIEKTKRNCIRISIYEKFISQRLNIPAGNRNKLKVVIPKWILSDKSYIISYLRGLYEAEGSFCIHKPTGTYKILFSNRNPSLLKNVYQLLKMLEFHPHKDAFRVQISKKNEVYSCKNLLNFRNYT
jgi:DNA-binding transcriptional regulator WhiA